MKHACGRVPIAEEAQVQEVDMGTLETLAVVSAVYAVVFLGNRASRALMRQLRP